MKTTNLSLDLFDGQIDYICLSSSLNKRNFIKKLCIRTIIQADGALLSRFCVINMDSKDQDFTFFNLSDALDYYNKL